MIGSSGDLNPKTTAAIAESAATEHFVVFCDLAYSAVKSFR
jgi:hypothetical protein